MIGALVANTLVANAAAVLTLGGVAFPQADILDARAQPGLDGGATVLVTVNPVGAQRLRVLTTRLIGAPMPIAVGERRLAAPTIVEPLDTDTITISGARDLADAIVIARTISGRDPLPDALDE